MTTVAERVARGAALLDEKLPGWDQRIDAVSLDIDLCESCVLGQLFAVDDHYGYLTGLRSLGVHHPASELDYGFDGSWDEIDDLTAEWKRVINGRRST
jgi:hypothetical protein